MLPKPFFKDRKTLLREMDLCTWNHRKTPFNIKPEHSLPCFMKSPAAAMGLPMHLGCGSTRSKPSCLEPTSSSTASIAACFYHVSADDGSLDAVLIVHVDDFMCTYSESFPLQLLEEMFEWASVTKIDENHPGEYGGKEITMINANGKLSYKITQKKVSRRLD